jgi:hypothetical protein
LDGLDVVVIETELIHILVQLLSHCQLVGIEHIQNEDTDYSSLPHLDLLFLALPRIFGRLNLLLDEQLDEIGRQVDLLNQIVEHFKAES